MQLACTVGDINMWPKRCYVHRFAHLLVWNRTQTIDFDCNFFKYTLALLNALLSVVFFFFAAFSWYHFCIQRHGYYMRQVVCWELVQH